MSTLEQIWDVDPEPDPEPQQRKHYRDPAVEDWQKAQDQYETHLDRLGGDTR